MATSSARRAARRRIEIESVELDGGVEVGPKLGHPHFHLLLTLTHFTYLQFDYYTMKVFLEIMFKGLQTHHGFPTEFRLGTPDDLFYGDNENPYVDLRLYPADNFMEVLHKYVRKNDAFAKVSGALMNVIDNTPMEKDGEEGDDEADEEEAGDEDDNWI